MPIHSRKRCHQLLGLGGGGGGGGGVPFVPETAVVAPLVSEGAAVFPFVLPGLLASAEPVWFPADDDWPGVAVDESVPVAVPSREPFSVLAEVLPSGTDMLPLPLPPALLPAEDRPPRPAAPAEGSPLITEGRFSDTASSSMGGGAVK